MPPGTHTTDWRDAAREPERFAVGLMSGTSCDGMDAAVVRLTGFGHETKAELCHFESEPYTPYFHARLLAPNKTTEELALLNVALGERLAEAAYSAIEAAAALGIRPGFIASHGHTVAHCPPRSGLGGAGTLQLGDPSVIAECCGLPVVSDFRPRDIAAGGQGAPLVPYPDWLMFRREGQAVATLNLGGIANFTVVTPALDEVYAFDTGPANMLLNDAVRLVTNRREVMDLDGEMAARGQWLEPLGKALLDHPFFRRHPPKSTGREKFGADVYLAEPLALLRQPRPDDVLATVTKVVAKTIADAFKQFIAASSDVDEIVAAGGGVHNATLMKMLAAELPGVRIRTTDEFGIPTDAREAVAFAILGDATLQGVPANVPKATGATHPVVLGRITPL